MSRSQISFIILGLSLLSLKVSSGERFLSRPDTRFIVSEKLLKVFGSSKYNKDIVDELILSKVSLFGGPCDEYSDLYKKEKGGEARILTPNDHCYSNRLNQTFLSTGRVSFLREVNLRVSCDHLVENEKNISYISKNLPKDYSIQDILELFYPGKKINKKSFEKFVNDIERLNSNEKLVIMVRFVCKTGLWQY